MAQHYHHGLVVVSLLVAILASYTALTLAMHIRLAAGVAASAWLVGGGFAMGVGIWAMHFVGMLALTLPIQIAYDVWITLASMAIAIVVSSFALHIASRQQVTRGTLVTAGIAMGIGICSMHYVGMAAIDIAPPIRYDAFWVAASFAIAIAASFGALWVAFTSREQTRWWRYRRVLGASVMGFAITGMHYAGMLAANFPPEATSHGDALVNRAWLAGAVSIISVFVLLGALLLSLLEAQAAARTAKMQAIIAEVATTSRAKDEFLAILGHELRNPLASIANAIVLIDRAAPGDPDWKLARDVLARQAAHLGRIVDDLLDVGRAVAGKMSLNMQPLGLRRVVAQALGALAARTAGRRVEFQGVACWVQADRTRIEQVVTNLVANAVQHTAAGGSIRVEVFCEEGQAGLRVSDDGAGMDEETALRAFELFFQAPDKLRAGKGGLGIGLTLVRRIVELHGGTVSAESKGRGAGATFTVRLPLIAAPRRGLDTGASPGVRAARSIVVVEDADDARATLHRLLEGEGHSVCAAADGESGLRAILDRAPDVAIVDIGLPGLDGYELARRVRSAGVPAYLIALTGYGLPEDRQRADAAGFDVHLTKPASVDELLKLVADASS
jgi:NO-binding membrane sensor protein with MHYT domain/CheY-like chemotaxis protein/two-component sensor histidine kinase